MNATADTSLLSATLALQVGCAVLLVPWLVVLGMELRTLPLTVAKHGRETTSLHLLLLGNSACSIVFGGMALLMSAVPYSLGPASCEALGRALPVVYLLAVLHVLLFFTSKAKLVGRFEPSTAYQAMARFLDVAPMVFVLLAMAPLAGWVFRASLTPAESACVLEQNTDMSYLIFGFLAGDVLLTVALTALFVVPFVRHSRQVRSLNADVSDRMLRVAWENTVAAGVALTVTLATLLYFCVAEIVGVADASKRAQIVGCVLMAFVDISVNGAAARSMTTIWLPLSLRQQRWLARLCAGKHELTESLEQRRERGALSGNGSKQSSKAVSSRSSKLVASPTSAASVVGSVVVPAVGV